MSSPSANDLISFPERVVWRGSYRLTIAMDSSVPTLLDSQLEKILQLISAPVTHGVEPLAGRASISGASLEGVGNVVMKHYTRGGLLRYLNRNLYLGLGRERAWIEFLLLRHVRSLGVGAPEPLLSIRRGGIVYRNWLVMRRIEGFIALLDLFMQDEDRARAVLSEFNRQVTLLIRNRIHHIDLHPGNVLITPDNKVWLVDFDKAGFSREPLAKLRERYILRWRRAVLKHRLPDALSEIVSHGLRSHRDGLP